MPRFKQTVLAALQSEATLSGVQWTDVAATSSNDPMIVSRVTGGAPVLELHIMQWGLTKHDDDSGVFVPLFVARARLVRAHEVVWEAVCDPPDRHEANPPRLHELRTDRERLNTMLTAAIDLCAADLGKRFVGQRLAKPERPDKRELKERGRALADIESALRGRPGTPGLVAGPARFEAKFEEVSATAADVPALQRLALDMLGAPAGSELKIAGLMDGAKFEVKIEKNKAGRVEGKFKGLRLQSDDELTSLLRAFTGPVVRRVEFEGEVAGRSRKAQAPETRD
jgi:hypothetical protein